MNDTAFRAPWYGVSSLTIWRFIKAGTATRFLTEGDLLLDDGLPASWGSPTRFLTLGNKPPASFSTYYELSSILVSFSSSWMWNGLWPILRKELLCSLFSLTRFWLTFLHIFPYLSISEVGCPREHVDKSWRSCADAATLWAFAGCSPHCCSQFYVRPHETLATLGAFE